MRPEFRSRLRQRLRKEARGCVEYLGKSTFKAEEPAFWCTNGVFFRLIADCEAALSIGRPHPYIGRQVMSTRTGISFLIGIVRNVGGSILKSEQVAGTVPAILTSLPVDVFTKGTRLYLTV